MDDQTTNPTQDPVAPPTDQPNDGSQPQGGGNDQWQPATPVDAPIPDAEVPAQEEPVTPPADQTPVDGGEGQSQDGDTNQGTVN